MDHFRGCRCTVSCCSGAWMCIMIGVLLCRWSGVLFDSPWRELTQAQQESQASNVSQQSQASHVSQQSQLGVALGPGVRETQETQKLCPSSLCVVEEGDLISNTSDVLCSIALVGGGGELNARELLNHKGTFITTLPPGTYQAQAICSTGTETVTNVTSNVRILASSAHPGNGNGDDDAYSDYRSARLAKCGFSFDHGYFDSQVWVSECVAAKPVRYSTAVPLWIAFVGDSVIRDMMSSVRTYIESFGMTCEGTKIISGKQVGYMIIACSSSLVLITFQWLPSFSSWDGWLSEVIENTVESFANLSGCNATMTNFIPAGMRPNMTFLTAGYHHSDWTLDQWHAEIGELLELLAHRQEERDEFRVMLQISPKNSMIPDKYTEDRERRTSLHTYQHNLIILEQAREQGIRTVDISSPEFVWNKVAHRDAVHIDITHWKWLYFDLVQLLLNPIIQEVNTAQPLSGD